ncbi:MAG TPA: hypothetical protein VGQ99_09765 [Tepidisphaeraceae bacterium]|nr:hypothetical protein [Tepidisphaeraceae bacterium]
MSSARNSLILTLCASATLFFLPSRSHAVQRFWNNPAGGSFNLGANWQGGVVPGAADDAYFGVGDYAHTVTFPTNVSNDQLTILQHDVTFDLLGHQYQLTSAATDFLNASFVVGNNVGDNGIIHVTNGTLTANVTYVGQVGGSDDNLFVSTLGRFNATTLDIGAHGIGNLHVENGGIVNSTTTLLGTAGFVGSGHVTVNGPGSQWANSANINIGNGRPGFLNIESAGLVTTLSATVAGPSSILTVTGLNSRLNVTDDLEIGPTATPSGTLNVTSGGAVNITDFLTLRGTANVADAASALHSRILTIFGGTLNHTGGNIQASTGPSVPATGIYAGLNGGGAIEALAGAHLNTTGVASIGHFAGSSGSIILRNAGTNWTHAGELNVGVSGSAVFSISSGPTVNNTGIAYIARGAGSIGDVSIQGAGSRWDTTDLYVAANGSASLSVLYGAVMNNQNAYMSSNPGSSSTATIFDTASAWNTAGTLVVGGSATTSGGPANIDLGVAVPGGTLSATTLIKLWPTGQIHQSSGEIRTPSLILESGSVTQTGGLISLDSAISPFTPAGINIGINATGLLNISGGGDLITTSNAYVGVYGPSTGNVAVTGAGSTWTVNSLLVVGDAGKGILTVNRGASVSAAFDAYMGFVAGSTGSVTVDGAASTLTIGGNLDVATLGLGFLSIVNQAVVSNKTAFVGRSPGGKGTVKITDNFAEWQCTNLFIGGDAAGPGGNGVVNIANNGVLTVTGPITVWPDGTLQSYPAAISTSELRLRGGKFSAWSNFDPPISNGGGIIEVPGSNFLFLNGNLTSLPASILQRIGSGDLLISGAQFHAPDSIFQARGGNTILRTNAGAPATPASPASANLNVIVGPEPAKIMLNINQVFRNLTVSTSNPGPQSFDLNSPTIPGAFRSLSIYNGSKSDLWAAISSANRAGAPDPLDGIFDSGLASHPSSAIGLARVTDPHGDSYLLIRPTRIGDLNLDGVVTISDFIDLSSNFGASGPNITWQEGDLNYDNAVTISDFIDLSANFGSSYSGATLPISSSDLALLNNFASSPSPIPEPSTLSRHFTLTPLHRSRRTRSSYSYS